MQLFNMQRLIAFLPLIKVLLAQQQALSASEAQAIAWRSYGDFVTNVSRYFEHMLSYLHGL